MFLYYLVWFYWFVCIAWLWFYCYWIWFLWFFYWGYYFVLWFVVSLFDWACFCFDFIWFRFILLVVSLLAVRLVRCVVSFLFWDCLGCLDAEGVCLDCVVLWGLRVFVWFVDLLLFLGLLFGCGLDLVVSYCSSWLWLDWDCCWGLGALVILLLFRFVA